MNANQQVKNSSLTQNELLGTPISIRTMHLEHTYLPFSLLNANVHAVGQASGDLISTN